MRHGRPAVHCNASHEDRPHIRVRVLQRHSVAAIRAISQTDCMLRAVYLPDDIVRHHTTSYICHTRITFCIQELVLVQSVVYIN